MTPATEAENALLVAMHRAQFQCVTETFGETYLPLDGEDLAAWASNCLPLIRAHVERENAALREENRLLNLNLALNRATQR